MGVNDWIILFDPIYMFIRSVFVLSFHIESSTITAIVSSDLQAMNIILAICTVADNSLNNLLVLEKF